jgi:arylsulfatase A-like enzyme
MSAAANWIRTSATAHDQFFLFVDEFDPHEPFDTPLPYANMYDPEWDGPRVIWPPYLVDALVSGQLDSRTARHIRANYGAKLTMIDRWFGKLLSAIEDAGLTESTGIMLCTDHGHYLGEHDIFGKPGAPIFGELGRIPLLIRWPGQQPRNVDGLTTSVDLHATIADLFGATVEHPTHGKSLLPLIEGTSNSVREFALFGYWGRHVGITDGRFRYLRGCGDSNFPLSMWSNRWSTMPIPASPRYVCPGPTAAPRSNRCPAPTCPSSVSLSSPETPCHSGLESCRRLNPICTTS